LKAAGYSPNSIKLHIVNDDAINAFTPGGRDIYINSGLLIKFSEDPEAVQAIIAHEMGHIKGEHLARGQEYFGKVQNTILSSTILGIITSTFNPELGGALLLGGLHVGERSLLSYSRSNEEAADQAAISLLEASNNSASGFVRVLEFFRKQERNIAGPTNPYTRTHPMSREREILVKNHLKNSKYKQVTITPELQQQYYRAMVKLKAFLRPPEDILAAQDTTSINSRYVRVIAYYRLAQLQNALLILDHLIKEFPKDPYFLELKGQILYENGKPEESIPYYKQAHSLLPSALIKLELAIAYIAVSENNAASEAISLQEASNYLKQTLAQEPDNVIAMRQLAIAYGRQGLIGLSNLTLAEEAMLLGNSEAAKKFAEIAIKNLPTGSPERLRAEDVIAATK
jgi:predicted Zn-dependent protease